MLIMLIQFKLEDLLELKIQLSYDYFYFCIFFHVIAIAELFMLNTSL